MCVLISKFTSQNELNPKSLYRFKKQNPKIQILKDVKAKSWKRENLEIRHFCEILHDDPTIWKYASFEGSGISRSP